MTLADLIAKLVEYVYLVVPFTVVADWEVGCRVTLGHVGKNVGAGLVWHWPFITTIETADSNLQVIETDAQTMCADDDDGTAWTFSLGVSYEVVDAAAYYLSIQDHDSTVVDEVRAVAATWVGDATYPSSELESAILSDAKECLAEWGVALVAVRFVNLAPVQVLRLIQG